jgi:hypothetical protein
MHSIRREVGRRVLMKEKRGLPEKLLLIAISDALGKPDTTSHEKVVHFVALAAKANI